MEQWITPLREEVINAGLNGGNNVAANVLRTCDNITPGRAVALVGVDSKWANRVRRQLFSFAHSLKDSQIVDLGDLIRVDDVSLTQVASHVIGQGALPIFIGVRNDMSRALYQSLKSHEAALKAMFVQEAFPLWMPSVFENESVTLLGLQSHLLTSEAMKVAEDKRATWTRLSVLRDALDECEPEIRDAGFFNFDASALRSADCPAQISYSSSGLFTEEACRIMRYAGLSSEMRCISLSGHDPLSAHHGLTANTMAQLLWYFMSGFDQRVIERPSAGNRFTQYLVHMQRYDFDLTFFKSNSSGRWWLELPASEGTRVFSCAYGDYLAACENVVTDRVVKCVESSLDVAQN